MPTSIAKIEANRANDQRSTGPRTPEGKGRSRMNAVKHGWRGEMPIPAGEDAELFLRLRGQLIRSFSAVTDAERLLCSRIALAIWRGLRATRAETQTLTRLAASIADGPYDEGDPAATALSDLFLSPGASALPHMVRYERHLTREARDGIRMLKEVQAARRAHVDGSACIDVGTILEDPNADAAPPGDGAPRRADSAPAAGPPAGTAAPCPDPAATDAAAVDPPVLAAIYPVR